MKKTDFTGCEVPLLHEISSWLRCPDSGSSKY